MGNAELFHQVYAQYGPALYRFCLLQLKHPADAEDVLQEVFLKRLYRAPAFDSPEHEKRWLYRVALNQCRDELRRKRRTEVPLEEAALLAMPEVDRELGCQVSALPEKLRTVIHLHYYEGYTVEELAALLGVSVGAVLMRLLRGREALRREMEGAE